MDLNANLEHDLIKTDWLAQKCQNDKYAQNLYAALCNNRFFKNTEEWTCSWRHAGGIVADLRNKGEDYMDWYCSGIGDIQGYLPEGEVSSEITQDLLNLGWHIKPYELEYGEL
jgi:hypothetical protein